MSHWKSGPTFPLEEWLGKQKNILTREYHPRECLVWKRLVKGTSPVEESESKMDLVQQAARLRLRCSGASLRCNGDALVLLSGCGCHLAYIAEGHSHRNASSQQFNGLHWAHLGNTSRRVVSVWLIICALLLTCLLACLACFCSHFSANSCISWMSLYSSWALAWLASCRSLREEWYQNPSVWVPAGWQPNPLSVCVQTEWLSDPPLVWVHTSRSDAGAGKRIDRDGTGKTVIFLWTIP